MSELLLNYLTDFYLIDKNYQKLLAILKNNELSLRIIDWFVTNYSKKNDIYYYVNNNKINNSEGRYINVYQSYKNQLKSYSKKKFDPFCRSNRINFICKGNTIQTTIGQLNFFKWTIENFIIDYILLDKNIIEADMNNSSNQSNKKKKRKELSKSAIRGVDKKNIKVVLSFS